MFFFLDSKFKLVLLRFWLLAIGGIVQDFRKLKVWEMGHEFIKDLFLFLKESKGIDYFLQNQIKRSSCSITANISEGCGRGSDADFARFLQMAMGSACETENHLQLMRDLYYLEDKEHELLQDKIISVKKMLTVFMRKLRANSRKPKAES